MNVVWCDVVQETLMCWCIACVPATENFLPNSKNISFLFSISIHACQTVIWRLFSNFLYTFARKFGTRDKLLFLQKSNVVKDMCFCSPSSAYIYILCTSMQNGYTKVDRPTVRNTHTQCLHCSYLLKMNLFALTYFVVVLSNVKCKIANR